MRFIRPISVGTLLFFASTTLLAPMAEANLWQDRQNARARASGTVQVASVPSGTTAGRSLTDGLPAAAPLSPLRPAEHSKGRAVNGDAARILAAIPQNRLSIREVDTADAASPVVVVIQDVHLNGEAQSNISEALLSLLGSGAVGRIGVEGAFTEFDFSLFDGFASRRIVRDVAKDFMAAGLMAAPSYAGIATDNRNATIIGVDEKSAYERNVAAYRAAHAGRERFAAANAVLKRDLAERKGRIFTPALARLDALVESHEKGDTGLTVLLEKLSEIAVSRPKVVGQFLEASGLERSLNFPRVEADRRRAIESLSAKMTEPELKEMLERTLAFRSGAIGLADFHATVRDLCRKKGVDLAHYPSFDSYVRYALLAEGIDAEDLQAAAVALEEQAYARLTTTDEQRELVRLSNRSRLLDKLGSFSLTPAEWVRYCAAEETIPGFDVAILRGFEDFYRIADERSDAIVTNLLNGSRAMALVVGGFHTPHIADLLRKRGCSVIICSPRLTRVDVAGATAYLSVFTREKTPVERLFQGEKLFISPSTQHLPTPGLAEQLAAETAQRVVETDGGALPTGVTVSAAGAASRVVVGRVVVFFSRASRVRGLRWIGPRVGAEGSQFAEAPGAFAFSRAGQALVNFSQRIVDAVASGWPTRIALTAMFAVPASGVLASYYPVILGTLHLTSPQFGLFSAVLVIVFMGASVFLRVLGEANLLRSVAAIGATTPAPRAGVSVFRPEGEEWSPSGGDVQSDKSGRNVRVDEGKLVTVLTGESGAPRALFSAGSESDTIIQLRSIRRDGRVVMGMARIPAGPDHLDAIGKAIRAYRSQALSLGFSSAEVVINWNPVVPSLLRLRRGDLRAALIKGGAGEFFFEIKGITERNGRTSARIDRHGGFVADVRERPGTFAAVDRRSTVWGTKSNTLMGRVLDGAIWGFFAAFLPAAMLTAGGLFNVALVVSIISFVLVVIASALMNPIAPDAAKARGMERQTRSPTGFLPTREQLDSREYLVLSPTYGEGPRLEKMIRDIVFQDDRDMQRELANAKTPAEIARIRARERYLDRILYIVDGETEIQRGKQKVEPDNRQLLQMKQNGLPGLTPDQNERLKRALKFISFPQNRRKEGAIYSAIDVLRQELGRVPPVLLIQDSDSFLIGEDVDAQLEKGARQLEKSPHVAMGVPIDGDVDRDSSPVAWADALFWKIQGIIRRAFFMVDRLPILKTVFMRSVPGGAAFFKTDSLEEALSRHSGNFEAGDLELANLLFEADREENGDSARTIGDLFNGVRLRTDVAPDVPELMKQKGRWLVGQMDQSPAAAIAIGIMMIWAGGVLFSMVTPSLAVMAVLALAPIYVVRLVFGRLSSMGPVSRKILFVAVPVAILMIVFGSLAPGVQAVILSYLPHTQVTVVLLQNARWFFAGLAVLGAVGAATGRREKVGPLNATTLAAVPFFFLMLPFILASSLSGIWEGIQRRFLKPENYRVQDKLKAATNAPSAISARNAFGAVLAAAVLSSSILLGVDAFSLTEGVLRAALLAAAALPSFFAAIFAAAFVFGSSKDAATTGGWAGPDELFGSPASQAPVDFITFQDGRFLVNPTLGALLSHRLFVVRFTARLGINILAVSLHERVHAAGVKSEFAAYAAQAVPLALVVATLSFFSSAVALPLLLAGAIVVAAVAARQAARVKPADPIRAVARNVIAAVTASQPLAQRYEAVTAALAARTAPNLGVDRRSEGEDPLPQFDRIALAEAIGAELAQAVKDGRMTEGERVAVADILSILLISRSSGVGKVVLEDPDAPDSPTDGRALDTLRVLSLADPAGDALRSAAAWLKQRKDSRDTFVLVAAAPEAGAIARAALDLVYGEGVMKVEDAANHANIVELLEKVTGGLTETVLSTRRFRLLMRNDVAVPAGFFDLDSAGLPASARGLKDVLEVYMIIAEIMRAVRVEPGLLNRVEALRIVMIQA